ncbi:nuclear transport factor 2 family protein [Streptosporangium sp. CA-115845]|uniref:nuclear transport factor 2 family protein n=1 Tax=Streptosporangium sp. CA-115845 TaxID=3240071 RepID=UPI003D8B720B
MNAASSAEWLDKLLITELAQTERVARDTRQWDLMTDCYHPDSRVFLSWFDGTAAEFIAASKAMGEEPGGHATHSLGPTLVRIAGDRALADTSCAILFRRVFAGVECDMVSYCRHHSRVERVGDRWRLRSFVGVYEKNTLVPVIPGQAPAIDTGKLATFRSSYAFQSYFRAQQGKRVYDDRPGLDRPDLVARFRDAEERWLSGEDVPLGVGAHE